MRPVGDVVLHKRSHREIRKRTHELVELENRAGEQDSDSRVKIGRLLSEIRSRLEHGEWLAWLAEEAPFDERTAQRYIALSHWAEQQPLRYHDNRHLGPSKLYLLLQQPEAVQRAIFGRKIHPVAGTRVKRPLRQMSYVQVLHLVSEHGRRDAKDELTPAEAAAESYRRKLRGIERATEQLLEHRRKIDPQLAREWRKRLTELAEELAVAFSD